MTNDKSDWNKSWWMMVIAVMLFINALIPAVLYMQQSKAPKTDTLTPEVLAGLKGDLFIETDDVAVKTTLTPKLYTLLGTNWIVFKKENKQ